MPTVTFFSRVLDLRKVTTSSLKAPKTNYKQKATTTKGFRYESTCERGRPAEVTLPRLSRSSSSSSNSPTSSMMMTNSPAGKLVPQQQKSRHFFSFLMEKPAVTEIKDSPCTHSKKQQYSFKWSLRKKKRQLSPSQQPNRLLCKVSKKLLATESISPGLLPSSPQLPTAASSSVLSSSELSPSTCICTRPETLEMDIDGTCEPCDESIQQQQEQRQEDQPSSFRSFHSLPSCDEDNSSIFKRKAKTLYSSNQWPCVLTQDSVEQDRLVAQHYLLRTAFGGDYHAPVHSLLSQKSHHQQQHSILGLDGVPITTRSSTSSSSFSASALSSSCGDVMTNSHFDRDRDSGSSNGPVVLDVGCGLGQWCMEMATAYPKATFVGIDLLPTFPRDIKPRNCHFRQVNIRRLPLPFPDQSVDFVYQRDLNWGLAKDDFQALVLEYMRIIKPGGWIELVEADLETKSSWEKECMMNDRLLEGLIMRGQDPYVARKLPTILAVHGFRRVESHFQSLPLGWENKNIVTDDTPNSISKADKQSQAMASQYLFYLRSLGPWLRLVMGLSQSKYVEYVDQLPCEWAQAQTYVNWHCAIAQKPYE